MRRIVDLSGEWRTYVLGLDEMLARLPGSLDENCIGFRDDGANQWKTGDDNELIGGDVILTRLTRKYTYEGPARFMRNVEYHRTEGERVFLDAERSRELTCEVNGTPIAPYVQGTVSTAYTFEITDALRDGENEIALICDNSYPSWPHDAIVYSSAATDETQTNWNGVIGKLQLRYERRNYIEAIRVYPDDNSVRVCVDVDLIDGYDGEITLQCDAFENPYTLRIEAESGRTTFEIPVIAVRADSLRWDEYEGNLYTVTAKGDGLDTFKSRFGLRTFRGTDGFLKLNGRRIFVRSEANCAEYPETGHMPMTVDEWKAILAVFKSYGVNLMRFHSHCPPDAAFTAADEMGIMMEPELSHWNPRTAFEDEKSWNYYRLEIMSIVKAYANHPSFVMLTLGNELHCGAKGYRRMEMLMRMAREYDPTRLYAEGSNPFYGQIGPHPDSDFYTSSDCFGTMVRATSSPMAGFLNNEYPNTHRNFDEGVGILRREYKKPIFGFEVGQYEVLPDFDEIEDFKGVTDPANYRHIRQSVIDKGFIDDWKKRVEATGELSLIGYRAEVEAVMRTEGMSGLSLLGLQDFPGQGTALVGMLNAHLQPKPYSFAQPERFKAFFTDAAPLLLLDRRTFSLGDTVEIDVKMANYTRHDITGEIAVSLMCEDQTLRSAVLPFACYTAGKLSYAGHVKIDTEGLNVPAKYTLHVQINGLSADYPIWIYDVAEVVIPDGVRIAETADEALELLKNGDKVLLSPVADEEHMPSSIKAQFSTDFWSVGTFEKQSGFMGCMVEPEHPVFAGFPTDFHSDWQWWQMSSARAMVLPDGTKSLITGLDCYARMRNLGLLIECRCGGGSLMISSMGLHQHLDKPEVRAMLQSVLDYIASVDFAPDQEIDTDMLKKLIK